MGRTLVPRYLATLELSRLSDDEVHQVVDNVKLAAPTSAVVAASPALQASVAALNTKDATFAKCNTAVGNDRQTLKIDIAVEGAARADVYGELRNYETLLTNGAKSPGDIHAGGLLPRPPPPPKNQQPTVPESIDTRFPKYGHGKLTVSAHETGATRHLFVAQQSVNSVTWTTLGIGYGKSRVVTGATGAKIWVRFAMVRGQMQSDYCTPILVTIP